MDVLILGGASRAHEAWVREVARALRPHFGQVVFLDYEHWKQPDKHRKTDIALELGRAADLASQLESGYAVVAKSVGSVIALLGIVSGQLKPSRCVLLGLPLDSMREQWQDTPEIASLTPSCAKPEDMLPVMPPTTIVQNEHDPYGSAKDVAQFVEGGNNDRIHILPLPGDTHDYTDYGLIARLVAGSK